MRIMICPGVHPPELTEDFIRALPGLPAPPLIFPAKQPAYSSGHIVTFLWQQLAGSSQDWSLPVIKTTPIVWIGFSAGVVGVIGAAHLWQKLGGQVVALIALDGWGVPLLAPFPIHRLSHDAFTHWSSAVLGAGETSFYAEPAVAHLDLWRSPQQARGWAVQSSGYTNTTAAQFVADLLQHYSAVGLRSRNQCQALGQTGKSSPTL